MKIAFASVLDQSCLYGTGPTNNQPLGVISTTGTNSVTTANPPVWNDLAAMRYVSTNYDANGPAADIVVGPFSRAELGEVTITGSAYVDVAVRWPALFSYSQANIFPT